MIEIDPAKNKQQSKRLCTLLINAWQQSLPTNRRDRGAQTVREIRTLASELIDQGEIPGVVLLSVVYLIDQWDLDRSVAYFRETVASQHAAMAKRFERQQRASGDRWAYAWFSDDDEE